MTKLIIVFHNFANAPKKGAEWECSTNWSDKKRIQHFYRRTRM